MAVPIDRDRLRRFVRAGAIAFVGGTAMARAAQRCCASGFPGAVWLVNDRHAEIDGVPCVARVADLPLAPDAVFIGTAADRTIDYVAEFAAAGAGGVACFASGFAEVGRPDRQDALVAAAGAMPLLGPNCFGMLDYLHRAFLWPAAFGAAQPSRGAAILTQSGNFAYNISMLDGGLALAYLVSLGNQARLGVADLIDVLLEDDRVTAFGLHMEAIGDPVALEAVARKAAARGIPIVALRGGRSDLGARIALSHTSSLAGTDAVCTAFLDAIGIIGVDTPTRFVDALTLLQTIGRPPGGRIGAMVCSGGDAGFIADGCARVRLNLPAITPGARDTVAALLPDYANVANPLDFTTAIWGQHEPLEQVSFALADQPDVDVAFAAIDYPRIDSGERPEFDMMAAAFGAGAARAGKPAVIASIFAGLMPAEKRRDLVLAGRAAFDGLDRALDALAVTRPREPGPAGVRILTAPPRPARTIAEAEAKAMLARYGLATAAGRMVHPDDAAGAAAELPGPYALKVAHDALPHKSDVGGVILDLATPAAVGEAAAAMRQRLRDSHPHLDIDRMLVETMLPAPLAELIVGVARDPVLGMHLVLGSGGVMVELLQDSAIIMFPATLERIVRAIGKLRLRPLLDGFRGAPPADIDAIVAAVEAIAAFALDHADDLAELDVNPLMVFPDRAVAADALIRFYVVPDAR